MASVIYGVQQVSEISPNLYLTSIYGATKENISRRNVTLLINAAQELPKAELNNVEVVKLFLDDTPYALISVYFDRIADKIHEHLSGGGKVLVHCVLGVSRSTSLCLAYFMKYKNMTLKQAFEHISSKRPCARPNPGFWRQLIDYEKRILNNKIINGNSASGTNANNSTSKNGSSTSIPITIVPTAQSTNTTSKSYLFNSGSMPLLKAGSTSNNNAWMSNENGMLITQPSKIYKNSARNSARQSIRNRVESINNIYKSTQFDNVSTPITTTNGTASYQIPSSYHRTTLLINPTSNNNQTAAAAAASSHDYLNKPTFTTTYRSSYGTTRY